MEASAGGGGWSTLDPAAMPGGSISGRRRRMVDVRSSGGASGSISTRRMVDVGSCVVVVPEDRLLVAARPAGPLTHRSHVAGPGTRPPCSPSPSYRTSSAATTTHVPPGAARPSAVGYWVQLFTPGSVPPPAPAGRLRCRMHRM